jgi:hypothetical protein
MELTRLLQVRTSWFWAGKVADRARAELPSDDLIEIYIAHHYRGLITNKSSWSSAYVMAMIKGDARKFAEKSVADYPAPTDSQIAEADAAVDKYLPKQQFPFAKDRILSLPAMFLATTLLLYVGLPALIAAVIFRGGLALLIAGVTHVRKDGQRASRLRLLWRAMVTWAPVFPVSFVAVLALAKHWTWEPWLALALLAVLAGVSVALPQRGLQDRLAGTWPVPR